MTSIIALLNSCCHVRNPTLVSLRMRVLIEERRTQPAKTTAGNVNEATVDHRGPVEQTDGTATGMIIGENSRRSHLANLSK